MINLTKGGGETGFQSRAGATSAHPPICAIGASAGGIAALQDFFAAIDDDLGLAYVVVIHLAPDRPSHLSAILAGRTKMSVEQVEKGTKVRPNCVYVISPDCELVIEGDELLARPITEPPANAHPSICFSARSRRHGGMGWRWC